MKIRNYIWDFDGMLFDSYDHTTEALLKVLREEGRDADYKEMKSVLEESITKGLNIYCETPEEKVRFREYENDFDALPLTLPYRNTAATLKRVVEAGGRNFLYTHRDFYSTDYYLKKFSLWELFSGAVTADDGFQSKPSPDAILHLVKTYGLDSNETMMFGDREIDVLSGNNAGVKSCLYSTEPKDTAAAYQITDIIEALAVGGIEKE